MNQGKFLERMHNIQDTYGYIPEGEIDKIAKEFDIPRARVYGTIRFYSMFYTEPMGKYIIRVCDSLSCYLNGSNDILQTIKDYLNIDNGETSEDKKFTLQLVECLGYCGEGPVMMINDQVYTHLSKTMVVEILKKCI